MPLTVAAIITTTDRNKQSFERLIHSLCLQTHPVARIIVVYDGQLRPEQNVLETCPLAVTWIDNAAAQSLTKLQNRAIQFGTEDAILLLNDDVVLTPEFTARLVQELERDATIGSVCGKLLRFDKKTIDTAGQLLARNRRPVERGYGMPDTGQYAQDEFIFGACGAAVLYRRTMLEAVAIEPGEYFDSDYNMFYEDLDLSWRAANAGWKTRYVASAEAYHQRGATAREKKPALSFLTAYNFAWLSPQRKTDVIKNRYMTIIKNDSRGGFLRDLPFILGYEIKMFLYCLVFDPGVIVATARYWPLLRRAWEKRRKIKTRIGATA